MSAIQIGDLIIVRRNHCSDDGVGRIAKVTHLLSVKRIYCSRCRSNFDVPSIVLHCDDGRDSGFMPRAWVTKIEPLPAEQIVETAEPALV